jgi:nucleotide-binding universal stress UspA family protein
MNAIVVGVDGSPTARKAAAEAAEMARCYERPLHLVMAVAKGGVQQVSGGGSATYRVDPLTTAEEQLLALAGELKSSAAGLPITTAVVVNDPAGALCDEARNVEASVIVVGNKRVQGAARILGSIAGDVAKAAPCNVLIVHTV